MHNNNSLTFNMSKDLEFVELILRFDLEKYGKMT